MKNFSLLLISFVLVAFFSCTKDFESINTDPTGIPYGGGSSSGSSSTAVADASGYLPTMMDLIYPCNGGTQAAWVYQIQQNFNSDIYSGYWMQASATGFGKSTACETNYYLVQGWDDWLYSSWSKTITPFSVVQASAWAYPNTEINQSTLGMAYATKVIMSARVADAVGTLPYKANGASNSSYDPLDTIYHVFFRELDSANYYLAKNATSTVGSKDYFYAGDNTKWIKLVNSLRLQLAMRIVKADPTLAKAQAEKAMATGNLITDNANNAAYKAPFEGALTTLFYVWGAGNTATGADLYSYLVGYNDPRLSTYISPTSVATRIPAGGYATVRLGSAANPGDNFVASKLSFPGTGIPQSGELCSNHPEASTFFNAAETNFLLAEASLRGWNMGAYTMGAEAYYNAGVQASMSQWGVAIGTYLSTTARPVNFIDPSLAARDKAAVSNCSPKWSDASTNEGHLEQIMTQKWLALWPVNSSVAWAEYRRTGYPKLFPAYYSAVEPTITWGGLTVNNARKIMLPDNEYKNNTTKLYEAINNYLGGADNITTHVWWDVNAPNF